MKIIRIACISILLAGTGLLVCSVLLLKSTIIMNWCIGLASALIVLGLGYLINTFFPKVASGSHGKLSLAPGNQSFRRIKEKAGYLVCKIMNILLCIHLLLLHLLRADFIIILISIVLVLLQFILDFTLQILFLRHLSRDNIP